MEDISCAYITWNRTSLPSPANLKDQLQHGLLELPQSRTAQTPLATHTSRGTATWMLPCPVSPASICLGYLYSTRSLSTKHTIENLSQFPQKSTQLKNKQTSKKHFSCTWDSECVSWWRRQEWQSPHWLPSQPLSCSLWTYLYCNMNTTTLHYPDFLGSLERKVPLSPQMKCLDK